MIVNEKGSTYEYDGVVYTIGDRVRVAEHSDYAGLEGHIKEICTDGDMDTGNFDIDIYCDFERPSDAEIIRKLEKTFSSIFGSPHSIDDINIDEVVMAPDEIEIIS